MTAPTPAGWHPDPTGVFDHRWWDGARWTEQVAKTGVQSQSAMPGAAAPVQTHDAAYVQRQVQRQAGVAPTQGGGGTMFTEPVLVVNQKAKLIELSNSYAVYDQSGNQLGSVNEIGQSTAKKALRLVSNVGGFLTHKLEVRDGAGIPVLLVTRPAKMIKSRVIVEKPGIGEIGQLVQQNAVGKIRFALVAGGPAGRHVARGELAGLGLRGHRHHRHRGRADQEDVRGARAGDVHRRRQLRRADPPAVAGSAAVPGGGERAHHRHRPEAGRLTAPARASAAPDLDPESARRLRRSGITVLAILQVLVVGVGLTSSADLRQLTTAHGTARAFVEAAFASDCDRIFDLYTADAGAAARAVAPATVSGLDANASPRLRACQAVTRTNVGVLRATAATETSGAAVVQVDATDGTHEIVRLIHTGGRWRVTAYTPNARPILVSRP